MAQLSQIKPGTPEMEALLGVGYGGMTAAYAQEIVAARKKDPATYPFAEGQKAEAFLSAYRGTPQVISKRVGSTLKQAEA
jgi:hypothetical protein